MSEQKSEKIARDVRAHRRSLRDIMKCYPVDEATGQDFRRREENRARLLQYNSTLAQPFVSREPDQPDQSYIRAQDHLRVRKALIWLIKKMDGDLCALALLQATFEEREEYRSSQGLSKVTGLSLTQVKSAKERLSYALRREGASSFEELVDILSEKSE